MLAVGTVRCGSGFSFILYQIHVGQREDCVVCLLRNITVRTAPGQKLGYFVNKPPMSIKENLIPTGILIPAEQLINTAFAPWSIA